LYTTDNQRETAFILKDPSQVNSQAERLFWCLLKKFQSLILVFQHR
jgi:hypothetical protein